MNKFILLNLAIGFLSLFNISQAQTQTILKEKDLNYFANRYSIKLENIKIPTRVKFTLPTIQAFDIAITDENFVPYSSQILKNPEKTSAEIFNNSPIIGDKKHLLDNDIKTATEFSLDEDLGQAFAEIKFIKAITSGKLELILDQNVALPYQISIKAVQNKEWKTLLAPKKITSSLIEFPETTANIWKIIFIHPQPLRIKEINFLEKNLKYSTEYVFLATPNTKYYIFTDAEKNLTFTSPFADFLGKDLNKIIPIKLNEVEKNPIFTAPDEDKDGIPNKIDNCLNIPNSDQKDSTGNGKGDACSDFDFDSILNYYDNCPNVLNSDQIDTDSDKIGDVCDNEDSRITKKWKWLPWISLSFVIIIISGIIYKTIKK